MKKLLFFAAAAFALASCSNNENSIELSSANDNAISFNAYTATPTTRGVVEDNEEITKQAGTGIGVFAFYQPSATGDFTTRKYSTPDFMYNQKVNCPTTAGTWEYSPIKFWPNNPGDKLSFFAYAPYDADKTWEDMGISTNVAGTVVYASFPIYAEKTAMKDIIWADPVLNKCNQSTTTANDTNAVNVNEKITFKFSHILSKVAIHVGVKKDEVTTYATSSTTLDTPTTWTDDNTDITIDKIEFTNLADAYNYTYTYTSSNGLWTPALVNSSTTQNIILSRINGDFSADSSLIENIAPWNNTTAFHDLLAKEDSKDAFLFLAPQTFTADKEQVIITYTVKTTSTDPKNCSTITNTITTNMVSIISGGFQSGKAYTLKFLIGMNSVKISATVGTWDDQTPNQVNVPANQ